MTDMLTNDEISLLRSLEKKSRTITGNFTHKRYDRLETQLETHLLICDPLPFLAEVLGRAPGQRLGGRRGVVRATGAHHRGAENTEVRHLVREAEAVDPVGLGVISPTRVPP